MQPFSLIQEFPHLFPEKKPTALPPLREPAEIMQHRVELIPGATWPVRDWKQSYNRFLPEFTEKINSEIISGRIVPNESTQYITMFTKAKADKPEPRFLLDCVPRNKVTIKDKTPRPNISQIID